MMQKIGINKSKNNNIKYFKKIKESKIINVNEIEEINSLIIKSDYIDVKLMKKLNKIRLSIKTDIKIIYLKKGDRSLYVYKTSYINYEAINLPKIMDGYHIEDPSFYNKLKKNIYIENINTKILDYNILLSYFIVVKIGITPTYYIAYSIDNGFGDNIFLSHINGQVLTQQTFLQNTKINNLKWDLDGSKIWFISSNYNSFEVLNVNNNDKIVNKIENVNNHKIINEFVIKNKNKILIVYKNENKNYLYDFDIKKKQLEKIIKTDYIGTTNITEKPYYDNKNKLIYFLMGSEEHKHLYSIDENNNLDIIFNHVNISDYYVSYYLNNIIIKTIKEDKLILFEINLSSKFTNQINLEDTYEDILEIKFLYDFKDKRQILILTKNKTSAKDQNTLIIYDLNNYTSQDLINGNIVTFDIDYENLYIFVVYKKGNLSYVDKLNLNEDKRIETILKIPANIKDISLKKVTYEA